MDRSPLARTRSLGLKAKPGVPFPACPSRPAYDRHTKFLQSFQHLKTSLETHPKPLENPQFAANSQVILHSPQLRSLKHKQLHYRHDLDIQSGVSAAHAYRVNKSRFYGVETPVQDLNEATNLFFASEERGEEASPTRFVKTLPRNTLLDPITGVIRRYPSGKGRMQSLGRARKVEVTGKISDSPPPKRVYEEYPRFEKKIPRRMVFNPLTGEKKILADHSVPAFIHSFDYRLSPSPYPRNH